MGKAFSAVLLALLFSAPLVALADTSNQGNGDPDAVVNVWGLTNLQAPHVNPGGTVADAAGIRFQCPAFFTNYCVDITGTDYYKAAARIIARETGGFGQYAYWLTH